MTSADTGSNASSTRRHGAASAASFAVGLAAGAAGYAGYALTGRRAEDRESPGASTSDSAPPEDANAWAQIFDALDTGVAVVDSHDQIRYANPGARALGLPGSGKLEPAVLRSLTGHVRASGVKRRAELELSHRQELTAVRAQAALLPDGDVAVELIDVTEMHRVERVRRDFVANVGHELKTPVGALQLLAEALVDAVDDPQAAARFTARIQHESARMSRLVTELLELSRLQGAEALPEPETVSADRVVAEAIDRCRTAAAAKHMTLRRTGSRRLQVWGSESQLATAVGNLVENAVAYSPEGTTVEVSVHAVNGTVRICVADEGIGIAPEDAERIFERFYRADPARSRATGGTGLGLAIVKHIVGNHSGTTEVSSASGVGTTFTVALPVALPSVDETEHDVDAVDADVVADREG